MKRTHKRLTIKAEHILNLASVRGAANGDSDMSSAQRTLCGSGNCTDVCTGSSKCTQSCPYDSSCGCTND